MLFFCSINDYQNENVYSPYALLTWACDGCNGQFLLFDSLEALFNKKSFFLCSFWYCRTFIHNFLVLRVFHIEVLVACFRFSRPVETLRTLIYLVLVYIMDVVRDFLFQIDVGLDNKLAVRAVVQAIFPAFTVFEMLSHVKCK